MATIEPASALQIDLIDWLDATNKIVRIIPVRSPILADATDWWKRAKSIRLCLHRPTPRTDDMRQMIEDIANAS